ncbi:MAG: hypothetical protein LIP02_04120 [Bacteroidales bacterium]|nr:hypothetical protein [Bacteroidales bacterium]
MMENDGWIKISRKIKGHWIYTRPCYLRWWFDLLEEVAWEDHEIILCRKACLLRRGQMVASIRCLQEIFEYTDETGRIRRPNQRTVMRFLDLLENEGMVKRVYDQLPRGTALLTIVNYTKYQDIPNDYDSSSAAVSAADGAAVSAADGAAIIRKEERKKGRINIFDYAPSCADTREGASGQAQAGQPDPDDYWAKRAEGDKAKATADRIPPMTEAQARDYLDWFFSPTRQWTLDGICKNLGCTLDEFRAAAYGVVAQWVNDKTEHKSKADRDGHLVNQCRIAVRCGNQDKLQQLKIQSYETQQLKGLNLRVGEFNSDNF